MWAVLGFPVGLLLGVVLHRGDFCMQSAMREMLQGGVGPSTRIWLVGLGIQLVLVNACSGFGLLQVSLPPVSAPSAALGGIVFGIGMVLARG